MTIENLDAPASFDLLSQPWIPVVMLDGSTSEKSLTDIFAQAHLIREVVGELPTTSFALHRLLLAVLYRAIDVPTVEEAGHPPSTYWRALWELPELPDLIGGYLDSVRDRFDLLSETQPFFQVARLTTARGETSSLEKLIADVPNGLPYFTTRAGRTLLRISFAEAARWLVHAMAYDISGIKSGALGDVRVKGGKGYPIGTSWAGNLGGVLVEGDSLRETLLLNLVLGAEGEDLQPWSGPGDLALWERTEVTAAADLDFSPCGPASVMTWPSRRIRLVHDGKAVTGVLIANGDPLAVQNSHHVEPMTGWRRSAPQEKKLGRYPVYMPRTHDPERAVWRGLEALLPQGDREKQGADASPALPAITLGWVRRRTEDTLGGSFRLRTRAIGMTYGAQSSSTEEIVDDALAVHAALLASNEVQGIAIGAVRAAEAAVNSLGNLGRNLANAAGGGGDGDRDRARRLGFFALDGPFRQWLSELEDTDDDRATTHWHVTAHRILRRCGNDLLADAGPPAFAGRRSPLGRHIDAGLAELYFQRALDKALPSARAIPPAATVAAADTNSEEDTR